ncbi:MAG: hypothetical protein QOE66_1426 [Chloroflexota bacterium]|nr:hypothetical protein [Chloroflexota bacterium]
MSNGESDILATHIRARALLGGPARDEAKERGMVAGIMRPRTGGNTQATW